MNILYTSDNNYFCHMFTSIYSLLKNNSHLPLTVHIIESNLTREQIFQLESLFSAYKNAILKLYPIEKLKTIMDKFSIPQWRNTDIANARLFAHEIIDADKMIYIDSDTVVSHSLEHLYNTPTKTPISAVKELVIPGHMKNCLNEYYNSGVLLFDYNLWDNYDCLKLLFDTIKNQKIKLIYPDQDLLNISLQDLIGTLPIKYNITPLIYDMVRYSFFTKKYINNKTNFYSFEELKNDLADPCIYHMLQYFSVRPWMDNSIHPFNEVYDEYNWDKNTILFNSNSAIKEFVVNFPLSPLLAIILQITFGEDSDIKEKVKKILYKK